VVFDDFGFPCEVVLRLGGGTRHVNQGIVLRHAA
jgi:hypothetical protein